MFDYKFRSDTTVLRYRKKIFRTLQRSSCILTRIYIASNRIQYIVVFLKRGYIVTQRILMYGTVGNSCDGASGGDATKKRCDLQDTLCHEHDPKLEYKEPTESESKHKNVAHSVYLKLLLSEIQFLTAHARSGDTVIYILGGAVKHVLTLSKMFPLVTFSVYDLPCGEPTGSKLPNHLHYHWATHRLFEGNPRIAYKYKTLSNKDIKKFQKMSDRLLFVSDMRPSAHLNRLVQSTEGGDKEIDVKTVGNDIVSDLARQEDWITAMRPRHALLKFRLPYDESQSVHFLKGTMHLQAFTPATSTEVRLHVAAPIGGDAYERKQYSCQDHEQCMFYYNSVVRKRASEPSEVPDVDKKLAGSVLAGWVKRVTVDPDMSECGPDGREQHIDSVLVFLENSFTHFFNEKVSREVMELARQ